MKKYMVILSTDYTEDMESDFQQKGMKVYHATKLVSNFIIIETDLHLSEIKSHPLIVSAKEESVGHIDF